MNAPVVPETAAFLGNTLNTWMAALAILLAILLVWRVARSLVLRHVTAVARRTETLLDDLAVELLVRTRFYLVLVVAIYAASFALHLPAGRVHALQNCAVLALLLQGALWGNHLITFGLTHYLESRGADAASTTTSLSTLGFVGRALLWATLLLLALDNLGIKVTGLITGLGIGGVAVALAAQEVLKDLFASLAIALDKPFLVGDAVAVGTFAGTVEHIGIKTTRLRADTGEELVFANSDILSSRLRNYKRMSERRVVAPFSVAYDTPPEKLAAIPGMVRAIVDAQARVRFERTHLKTMGEYALVFELSYVVENPGYLDYLDAQQEIHLALLRRFQEEGIRLAYPTRTVRLESPTPADPTSYP